jgi:hypothetical protein
VISQRVEQSDSKESLFRRDAPSALLRAGYTKLPRRPLPNLITHHCGFPICGRGGGLGRGRRVGRGLGVTLGGDVGLTLGEGVVVGVGVSVGVAVAVGVVVGVGETDGVGVGVALGVMVGVGVALSLPLKATVTPAQGPTPCCTQHEVNVKST